MISTLTGPIPLAPKQTSRFFEFPPNGQFDMFLRAIALWTDNTALRGAGPTFQLRAPGGIFTDVEADGQAVAVTGADDVVGTATCQPEGNDIFLVTVSIDGFFAPVNPWHIRIINNADRELRFVTVSATVNPATKRPWIVIGQQPTGVAPTGAARFAFDEPSDGKFLKVSNWGTKELELFDEIDEPIGAEDSPLILKHRPNVVAPHGVDHMIIGCDSVGLAAGVPFRFASSDEDDDHGLIDVRVG